MPEPKIISGDSWAACELAVENELNDHPFAEATMPVRSPADGKWYSQVRHITQREARKALTFASRYGAKP